MVGDGLGVLDPVPDADGEGDVVGVGDGVLEVLLGEGEGDVVLLEVDVRGSSDGSSVMLLDGEGDVVWTGSTTALPAPDGDGDVVSAASTDGWVMPMIRRICCSYSSS